MRWAGGFWMLASGKLFCPSSFRVVPLPLSLRIKLPRLSKGLWWPFLDSAGFAQQEDFCCYGSGRQGPCSSKKVWGISSELSPPHVRQQLSEAFRYHKDLYVLPRLSDMAFFTCRQVARWFREQITFFFVNLITRRSILGALQCLINLIVSWECMLQHGGWWCTLQGESQQPSHWGGGDILLLRPSPEQTPHLWEALAPELEFQSAPALLLCWADAVSRGPSKSSGC